VDVASDWSDQHDPNTNVLRSNLDLNLNSIQDLSIDHLKFHLSPILEQYRQIGRDLGLPMENIEELLALFDATVTSKMLVDYCRTPEGSNDQLGHMMLRQRNNVRSVKFKFSKYSIKLNENFRLTTLMN